MVRERPLMMNLAERGRNLSEDRSPSVSSSRNEDSSVRGLWVTAYGYKQSPWVNALVSDLHGQIVADVAEHAQHTDAARSLTPFNVCCAPTSAHKLNSELV
jgi:hypothetical protein